MQSSSLVIVSPALAQANNGNWQTADRWRRHLESAHRVRITDRWPDAGAADDAVMLALHAGRSAGAIAAWAAAHGSRHLAVVLTGTDLYHAGPALEAAARQSLELAARLVVLQDQAIDALPPEVRGKARVIYQSTPTHPRLPKPDRPLRVAVVGHLRAVKSPETVFEAAALLAAEPDIRIEHAGDADAHWAARARAAQAASPAYRWLGPLPHAEALQLIQRAHLLLHPSVLEGGAHVVMEAVCTGTPVLASRVPGNVGMLGADYAGYFAHGDAGALARLLLQCRDALAGTAQDSLLPTLRAQCTLRAPLFDPDTERSALLRLVHDLLDLP